MCWVVFEVTVGSSNFPRRFHPKVFEGLSGFNGKFKGFVIWGFPKIRSTLSEETLNPKPDNQD